MAVHTCRSVLALESDSSAALAGAGITGDLTGKTIESSTTTTPTSRTAELSLIATTSVMGLWRMAPADFMPAHLREASPAARMGLQHRTTREVRIPERSVDSIMEASQEETPSVDVQAWAAGSMAEVVSMVAADTVAVAEGSSRHHNLGSFRLLIIISQQGEQNYAAPFDQEN